MVLYSVMSSSIQAANEELELWLWYVSSTTIIPIQHDISVYSSI